MSETLDPLNPVASSDLVAPQDAAPIAVDQGANTNEEPIVDPVGAHQQKGPQQGEMPFAVVRSR